MSDVWMKNILNLLALASCSPWPDAVGAELTVNIHWQYCVCPFVFICTNMDWFVGRQKNLSSDTVVYDLLTVAKPKQKKARKLERARSSQRRFTIHDKH